MKENFETFKKLKDNPLFKGLDEEEIRLVLEKTDAAVKSKKTGEYIFTAGDKTERMGIVLSGSVMVVQEDFWGHCNIMSRISEGDIFAEIFAAVPNAVMNVSVTANEDCEILLLNVRRLLSEATVSDKCINQTVRNLVFFLAKKTKAFNDKITHIAKRTTREKLLSFLSAESVRQGKRSFYIDFNRRQLADYLCVERAAMSVELSKLQKEGIISYNKNYFELNDAVQL